MDNNKKEDDTNEEDYEKIIRETVDLLTGNNKEIVEKNEEENDEENNNENDEEENNNNNNNKKIKIVFGVPCYGGMGYAHFFISLYQCIEVLKSRGINCYPNFVMGDSLITRARNHIVANFMNDKDATHLFFVDSDISFSPNDVLRLINDDKDIVGGIYPLKSYLWDKLDNYDEIMKRSEHPLNKDVSKKDFIRQNLMKYNLNYKSSKLSIENSLAEVKHIATGFMMIKRDVITKMIEAYPETKFEDAKNSFYNTNNEYLYSLFDCKIVDKQYYSEDWLFCHRWTSIGGEIYADVKINLTHIGFHPFEGRLLSSLNFT